MDPATSRDRVGLLEGLATTRAIRRFRAEPISDEDLATILFAASRGPSGSNRQPYRLIVLRDGDGARQAKAVLGRAARWAWDAKRVQDGYESGSGTRPESPKARMARTMTRFVERFEDIPVVVLACLIPYRESNPFDGASVYPACQNLLLAARAIGLGGVMTIWHGLVEDELKHVLAIPPDVRIMATIALGHPKGGHGPVRRRPLRELVFEDRWGEAPAWAVDPPGTAFTQAGPPPR